MLRARWLAKRFALRGVLFGIILTSWLQGPVRALAEDITPQDKCPGKNRALVLSGGGVRGAFQVGAVWYLVTQLQCGFKHFAGISAGGLHSSLLAQASDMTELRQFVGVLRQEWLSIRSTDDVYRRRLLQYIFGDEVGGFIQIGLGAESFYTLGPLTERVVKRIDLKRLRKTDNLTTGTVSLQDGKYHRHSAQSVQQEHLLATASIPVVFPPQNGRIQIPITIKALKADEMEIETTERLSVGIEYHLQFNEFSMTCKVKESRKEVDSHLSGATVRILSWEQGSFERAKDTPVPVSGIISFRHQMVDGGLRRMTPIVDVLSEHMRSSYPDYGFDKIYVVLTSPLGTPLPPKMEQFTSGFQILKRSLEILPDAIYNMDFDLAYQIKLGYKLNNDLLDYVQRVQTWREGMREAVDLDRFRAAEDELRSKGIVFPQDPREDGEFRVKPVDFIVIQPPDEIFDSPLEFDRKKIRRAMKAGCEAAWDGTRPEGPARPEWPPRDVCQNVITE